MMRGVDNWSLAVRKPDGEIWLDSWPLEGAHEAPASSLPVVRRVFGLASR